MNFKSVLIVTYGRSGSTLLQGLLNSMEGCVVRGENLNLCHGLFKAYQSLRDTRRDYGAKEGVISVTSPWFGAHLLDESRFFEDARALISHQLIGNAAERDGIVCYGFKEIRYLPSGFQGGKHELREYLEFLCRLFPDPAIVALTRDHEQVAKSAWWQNKDMAVVTATLSSFEGVIKEFGKGRNNVISITYQDMVDRNARISDLFEFLGAPYDEARVREVLDTRHSYSVDSVSTPRRKSALYKSRMLGANNIAHCVIDPIRLIADGARIRVAGVVVPSEATEAGQELLLVSGEREHRVEWGLPSPNVGAKFPNVANSAHSRFRIDIEPWKGGEMQLLLRSATGQRTPVAIIEVAA